MAFCFQGAYRTRTEKKKWFQPLNVVEKVFKVSNKDTRTITIDNIKHIHQVILRLTLNIHFIARWLFKPLVQDHNAVKFYGRKV